VDLNAILDRASSSDFLNYDPKGMTEAVNALQPLGKAAALEAIDIYLAQADQTADPRHGLYLVLRVLFEVPATPGYHPPVRIGGSMPSPPAFLKNVPLFPILLVDDVPIMLVSGYTLGGEPEPLSVHIAHFRAHGTMRARPLHPTKPASEVLNDYKHAYDRAYGAPPATRQVAFVQGQLERMK